MLQPKRTQYRKAHKGRIHGNTSSCAQLNFGAFGLKVLDPGRLTARQLEACRRAVTRHMKRSGRVWLRVFPDLPITKKPTEVRMGKGKGTVELWAARIKPGRIIVEVDGVSRQIAEEAFARGAAKLPFRTRVVARTGEGARA
ncbi:MAG: 50S ribosomal protein L16 [Alphaproteobacteria bacterium]|nr:50S ribosomal protein L16 [Alphaproteobacteria bacterium]